MICSEMIFRRALRFLTCIIVVLLLEMVCISECTTKIDKKQKVVHLNQFSYGNDSIQKCHKNKQDVQEDLLTGVELTVGIWDGDPVANFTINVILLLSKALNFSFNVKVIENKESTEKVSENAEIDMFGIVLALPERTKYMTFLHPVIYTSYVFVTKRNELQGFNITDPFSTPVWILLLAYGLLAGPIIHCLDCQTKTTRNGNDFSQINSTPTKTGIIYYIQYALASFLQQGGTYLPCRLPARVTIGCWWLFAVILVAMYTGTLVSKLFISKRQYAFTTLEELVDSEIVPVTLADLAATAILKNSPPDTDYGKLWKKMKTDDNVPVDNIATALDLTATGKYTYFSGGIAAKLLFIQDLKLHNSCRFSIAPITTVPLQMTFAVQRQSNYTEALNYGLAKLLQSDMITKLLEETVHLAEYCLDMPTQSVEAQAITLDQLSTAFWVILFGMSIAVFTLLTESLCYRI